MRTNDVGSIVVVRAERIVGIVTDRDIVLRAVAAGLDPETTSLGELMSPELATLPPDAEASAALLMMKKRGIRRVPLVENDRVVGMVTLDDLLLDEAAPLPDVAAVVRAQLFEGGPARTRRFDEWGSYLRRYARADATRAKLVIATQKAAKLDAREDAEKAVWIVLAAVARRITAAEAARVLPQLPALFRTRLMELPPGPDPSITRETVDAEISRELAVEPARAHAIVHAVGHALLPRTPAGERLRRYLPREMT